MAKANAFINTGLAAALGGLDGLASSRDQNKGRSWNSPGIAAGLAPVIGWGWAPVVQLGSLAVGGAAAATGRSWGTAAMCAGAATFTRAATFRLMQNRPGAAQGPVQGMVARPARMRPAYDPNASGPVTAKGWSGVPGVYGDPNNTAVQHGQASGLL